MKYLILSLLLLIMQLTPSCATEQKIPMFEQDIEFSLSDFPCTIQDKYLKQVSNMRDMSLKQMEIINNDRSYFKTESHNAKPLIWSHELWKIAICHAYDMCQNQYYSHINSKNQTPSQRANLNTPFQAIGENIDAIYAPYASENIYQEHHLRYMSQCSCYDEDCSHPIGHRANILNPNAMYIGIGEWYCEVEGEYYGVYFNVIDLSPGSYIDNNYCLDGDSEVVDEVSLIEDEVGE